MARVKRIGWRQQYKPEDVARILADHPGFAARLDAMDRGEWIDERTSEKHLAYVGGPPRLAKISDAIQGHELTGRNEPKPHAE